MNENIKKIYDESIEILNLVDQSVYYFRVQNYDKALRKSTNLINYLSKVMEYLLSSLDYFNEQYIMFDNESIMNMFAQLLDAQEKKDYVLLADLYELRVQPLFLNIQEIILSKEEAMYDDKVFQKNIEFLEKKDPFLAEVLKSSKDLFGIFEMGYDIESTSTGLMTAAITKKNQKFYLHSNYMVKKEASLLAHDWFQLDKTHYIIYGLGLGYHIEALAAIDSGVTIEVYESDLNIIKLAFSFNDLSNILINENIKIVYDPKFYKFKNSINNMSGDKELLIHGPSLRNISDDTMREKLEDYFLQYYSVKNQLGQLNSNFRENIKNYDDVVDSLKDKFRGKNLYIVAAGPSLDQNYQQLKEVKEDGIILATGTVFRKLINAGIEPDYLIVSDANERVYNQIRDLEHLLVPMIYLSTAYRGFAKNYQGKKYIAFQNEYPPAEDIANKNGYHLYQTGGSVSTTALDIGIALECKRIIFLGLDLSYPNNLVHASDTSRRTLSETEGLRQVKDINGDFVYTSKSLDIYRRWIEKRIKNVSGIEMIDATEGGAYIKGMQIRKLSEVL